MFWRSIVLPVRGAATMRPRCPLPIGVIRSITRAERLSGGVLQPEAFLRIERREVLEEQLLARPIGSLEVDGFDLDQREVAFAFLRGAGSDRTPCRRSAGRTCESATARRRYRRARAGSCSRARAGIRIRRAAPRARLRRTRTRSARPGREGSGRSDPVCACRSRRARSGPWRPG